jgi:hypothetical protein
MIVAAATFHRAYLRQPLKNRIARTRIVFFAQDL